MFIVLEYLCVMYGDIIFSMENKDQTNSDYLIVLCQHTAYTLTCYCYSLLSLVLTNLKVAEAEKLRVPPTRDAKLDYWRMALRLALVAYMIDYRSKIKTNK